MTTPKKQKRAAVSELRREIAELRNIGSGMANICWNLAEGRTFNDHDRKICRQMQQKWDAIKRAEKRGF